MPSLLPFLVANHHASYDRLKKGIFMVTAVDWCCQLSQKVQVVTWLKAEYWPLKTTPLIFIF